MSAMRSLLAFMHLAMRTLLTSETWQTASLQAIVTQALKHFQEQDGERIAVEGPTDASLGLRPSPLWLRW